MSCCHIFNHPYGYALIANTTQASYYAHCTTIQISQSESSHTSLSTYE